MKIKCHMKSMTYTVLESQLLQLLQLYVLLTFTSIKIQKKLQLNWDIIKEYLIFINAIS